MLNNFIRDKEETWVKRYVALFMNPSSSIPSPVAVFVGSTVPCDDRMTTPPESIYQFDPASTDWGLSHSTPHSRLKEVVRQNFQWNNLALENVMTVRIEGTNWLSWAQGHHGMRYSSSHKLRAMKLKRNGNSSKLSGFCVCIKVAMFVNTDVHTNRFSENKSSN